MCHRGETPEDYRQRKAFARAEPVYRSACEYQRNCIGQLERKDDIAVVNFVPAKLSLKCRLKGGDDLTIEIVECGCKKKQSTYQPTASSNARTGNPDGGDSGAGDARCS